MHSVYHSSSSLHHQSPNPSCELKMRLISLLLSSAAAAWQLSSSLWLSMLLLLLSLLRQCDAQQLLPELTDEAEVLLHPKFKRGYGEIREGSYIIGLLPEAVEVAADVAKSLINETLADEDGVVRAILQHAFFGFHWTEPTSKERRYAVLKRLLASSLVEFIEEDQKVGFVQTASDESVSSSNGNSTTGTGTGTGTGTDQICPPWGIDRIDQIGIPVNGVYHYDWTGSSVDAYVLDTGIRESMSDCHILLDSLYSPSTAHIAYFTNRRPFST
jgi:hypothetical protein